MLEYYFHYLALVLDCAHPLLAAVWHHLPYGDRIYLHSRALHKNFPAPRPPDARWCIYTVPHSSYHNAGLQIVAHYASSVHRLTTRFTYAFTAANEPIYRSITTGDVQTRAEWTTEINSFCQKREAILYALDPNIIGPPVTIGSDMIRYAQFTVSPLEEVFCVAPKDQHRPTFTFSERTGFRIDARPCRMANWLSAIQREW